MPTTKKRLNLSLPKETEKHLFMLAKAEGVAPGKMALELIELALEIESDTYFAEKAEKRKKQNNKLIPHEEAWKKILK